MSLKIKTDIPLPINLPPNILKKVVTYLDPLSIQRATRVNRAWQFHLIQIQASIDAEKKTCAFHRAVELNRSDPSPTIGLVEIIKRALLRDDPRIDIIKDELAKLPSSALSDCLFKLIGSLTVISSWRTHKIAELIELHPDPHVKHKIYIAWSEQLFLQRDFLSLVVLKNRGVNLALHINYALKKGGFDVYNIQSTHKK